jgi:hypothetical protein
MPFSSTGSACRIESPFAIERLIEIERGAFQNTVLYVDNAPYNGRAKLLLSRVFRAVAKLRLGGSLALPILKSPRARISASTLSRDGRHIAKTTARKKEIRAKAKALTRHRDRTRLLAQSRIRNAEKLPTAESTEAAGKSASAETAAPAKAPTTCE